MQFVSIKAEILGIFDEQISLFAVNEVLVKSEYQLLEVIHDQLGELELSGLARVLLGHFLADAREDERLVDRCGILRKVVGDGCHFVREQ